MEVEKMKKQTILRLKKVKEEQGLSISQIMDLLDKNGCYVSESSVKRVFARDSENQSFRYRDTIAPLADVLLDLYGDTSGLDDTESLKALIHEKNKMIEVLMFKNEEQKADFERRVSHLQKQIAKLDEHLEFREKMIERKDAIIEKLLNKIIVE